MAKLTPIKAIRAKCLDCCCGQMAEVRLCPLKDCSLHGYRMGKRPKQGDCTADTPGDEKSEDSPMIFDKNSHYTGWP